jgi:hypothetical protein
VPCIDPAPLWASISIGWNSELTRVAGHRPFHYELPRHSFWQDKWLDFDGVVGYIDLAREAGGLMPWARAAEALHFGQKSAFGLGKVRMLVLE